MAKKDTTLTRNSFLSLKIPVLPYNNISRGPSTEFNESFHIANTNSNCQLNIYWRCDGLVSVGFYDKENQSKWDRSEEVYSSNIFSEETLNALCNQYLR